MQTTFCPYWFQPVLLAFVLNSAGLLAHAATPGPVSEAWAVQINGPASTRLEASGIDVGPSGDVYVAGRARNGLNYDVVLSRRSPAGTLVWEKRYEPEGGSTGDESAYGLAVQGANVYVVGTIISATADGNQDFLTLKYRDTGELEWAARWDGAGRSNDRATAVAVDGQGNVLVAGDSTGTNGTLELVVLKYGPTGNLLWTYSYDGPEPSWARAISLRLDAGGNVHIAGTLTHPSDRYSVVTLKLDPAGRELWRVRETPVNGNSLTAHGLALDASGNVALVGSDHSYCMTWKYDANGRSQWLRRYRAEEPASMSAVDVRFDGNGNIITAANLYGSGTNDAVLIKYAADGEQLWATRISHPNGPAHLNTLALDGDGNSYLSVSPAGDVVTVKVSPTGVQLWAVTYNSQVYFADYGEFLKVTDEGDVFVGGRSIYFSETFISLVKYTQEPVAGLVTAVVSPARHVVDPGTDVLFTAQTIGPQPISHQWRMNGRPIPGATGPSLALPSVQVFARGDYSVIVSNLAGATVSPEARLSVRTPPEVTITPTQSVAYVGTDEAFVATLAGNDFATLQWRHNGTVIPGETNEMLRLLGLNAAASGTYDVVVSTFGGTTTSSAAGLTISGALELVGTTPHRSAPASWDYAPQFQVLPSGEFLIAARSNYLAGANIVLYKHAANGQLLWTAPFTDPEFTNAEPSRILLDAAGNIYVAGLSRQPYLSAALAILKYNPNGQLLWSRFLTGTNLWGNVHAFAVNPQGNSALAILGMNSLTLVGYDNTGALQWSFEDPSPDNDTVAVALDASGNTYLGTTIRVNNDNEIRLRKLDPTGATLWSRPFAEGRYNRLGALAVDAAGNLIAAGTGELIDVLDSRMFVQKYSPAGQKLWETRTGSSWSEINYVIAMAVGPGDEITVLTMSDDDYTPGEQSGVFRFGADGQLRHRVAEPRIIVGNPSQLALDAFGNAYVTGYGGRAVTGIDVVTAKYDPSGTRTWLVYHEGPVVTWNYGLAVGVDAAGDIRVLTAEDTGTEFAGEFSVVHYRQRDPSNKLRLQLLVDPAGTYHLGVPTGESFRIEASADLQNWTLLTETETQELLRPGATRFSGLQRFFRLIAE